MNKNMINEIKQMKFMFDYKPGKVLSEQNLPMEEDFSEMDDFTFADPDVMEPEVKPDTDRDIEEKPYRPSRPDRDPNRLPYTDPDTHPQGSDEDEIEYELEIDDSPRMKRPMGRRHHDENEPFMKRPMGRRHHDENEYEIEIDGDIEELFNR